MMTETQLEKWLDEVYLPDFGREKLHIIRDSPPVRSVGGGGSNVSGAYCMKKMGVTIQAESHTVELAFLIEYEHDNNVLEYFDQPIKIPLRYVAKSGKKTGVQHTPDYFVIREDCAGFEECKTEAELERLSQEMPNRYIKNEDGTWSCPPGEEYAAQLGFYYRIRSDAEVNWTFIRNADYLKEFYWLDVTSIGEEVMQVITDAVRNKEGLSLAELKNCCGGKVDIIFTMIANKVIFVDIYTYLLVEDTKVPVFTSEVIAEAYEASKPKNIVSTFTHSSLKLKEDECLLLDGITWRILQAGETSVILKSDNGIKTLTYREFEQLVKAELVSGLSENNEEDLRMKKASPKALATALERTRIVEQYRKDGTYPAHISLRTVQRYVKAYGEAEEVAKSGFMGVIPLTEQRGNSNPKLDPKVREVMEEYIITKHENKRAQLKGYSYKMFKSECVQKGIDAPSYKTFSLFIDQRPRFTQVVKRFGKRAAYKFKQQYLELTLKTPRHGDYPFHICHIDHTEIDLELRSSRTGKNIGKPWATYMIDAYTRTIVATYISYFPPSKVSCMQVLRECVKRNSRLPRIIITDGGREFRSTYFCTLLAQYKVDRKLRPPAQGRFGSVCERLFGTTNTQFVHNLLGNTKIMKKVREVTKSFNPKNLAIWTLYSFSEALREWAYEVYDQEIHPALGMSPREARAQGILKHGQREVTFIKYDRAFEIATLPTTPKGTAKVQPGQGIKINYFYYWHEFFRSPKVEKKNVPIRYDPLDIAVAYAFVDGEWVDCQNCFFLELQGYTLKELQTAAEEIRKQNQLSAGHTVNSNLLIEFLTKIDRKEKELENQAAEMKRQEFEVIEGGRNHDKVGESSSTADTGNFDTVYIDVDNIEMYGEY